METASNDDSSSNPGSPQRSKTRYKIWIWKHTHTHSKTYCVVLLSKALNPLKRQMFNCSDLWTYTKSTLDLIINIMENNGNKLPHSTMSGVSLIYAQRIHRNTKRGHLCLVSFLFSSCCSLNCRVFLCVYVYNTLTIIDCCVQAWQHRNGPQWKWGLQPKASRQHGQGIKTLLYWDNIYCDRRLLL